MPKTLLLADDSVTIQKVVGITFANEDVELVTAPNGDDALRKAKELKPDLVLADIGMPGLDGYELCAAIRSEPELASIPVLLLTGTFETYDEQRAAEVGASAYIAKPFEAQALIDQVYALLDGSWQPPVTAPAAADEAPPNPVDQAPAKPGFEANGAEEDDELPRAEAPDLLARPFGAATSRSTRDAAPKSDLSFKDLHFQEATAEKGSSTQIFGAVSPADAGSPAGVASGPGETSRKAAPTPLGPPGSNPVPSGSSPLGTGLPPAAVPDLEPPVEGSGFEPVAETEDTEPGLDQYDDTTFLDPLAEVPTHPDQRPAGEPSSTPDAEDPDLLDVRPFTGVPQPAVSESPVLEALELLPEAEPIPATPDEEDQPAPILGESLRADVDRAGAAQTPTLDRDAISSAVEKVAWEAFGSLSEQLVREVVKKVESIAWEVVPQLAERMIQEEIDRLKSQND